jgi:hypothetical protein
MHTLLGIALAYTPGDIGTALDMGGALDEISNFVTTNAAVLGGLFGVGILLSRAPKIVRKFLGR